MYSICFDSYMGGYVLLFLSILLTRIIKNDKQRLVACFVIITVFSGIRYGIGYDYYGYLETCIIDSSVKWEPIPSLFVEASKATVPFLFFILSSIFISFFYWWGIEKSNSDYMVELFFYLSFPFLFLDQLGIIRQGMATAAVFCAISSHNESILKRILLIAIAFFCHRSALIAVLILLPWNKLPPRYLWIMFISCFIFGSILVPLIGAILNLGFLDESMQSKGVGYLESVRKDEGRYIRLLIYLITIVSLTQYKRMVKINISNGYFLGLLVLGASLCALFSFNSTLSKRTCLFFFSSSILLIPYLRQLLRINRSIYYFLCIMLFSLTIFIGSRNTRFEDDPGCSVTYPYRTIFDVYSLYK